MNDQPALPLADEARNAIWHMRSIADALATSPDASAPADARALRRAADSLERSLRGDA